MAIVYRCDRCAAETESKPHMRTITAPAKTGNSEEEYDLCRACHQDLLDWIVMRPLVVAPPAIETLSTTTVPDDDIPF